MDNMEYIDDYFKSSPDDEKKQQFEQRILSDISFAEQVAFYISANGVIQEQLREEKKKRFREIYGEQKVVSITKRPFKKILRFMAAASAVAAIVILTWFLSVGKTSPQQMANQYIQQNFSSLHGVTMGYQDSLQMGIGLFNQGKLPEALTRFETIVKKDPGNGEAKKYAGIASLRLAKYDEALAYFSLLASDTSLYSNFGKFYEAVTLLSRDKTGDADSAKKLLQEVADDKDDKQEEKETAAKWLKKL